MQNTENDIMQHAEPRSYPFFPFHALNTLFSSFRSSCPNYNTRIVRILLAKTVKR